MYVTIALKLLDSISPIISTISFSSLDYSLLKFYKHHQLFVDNQSMFLDYLIFLFPTFFLPLRSNWYFNSNGSLTYK